MTKRIWLVVLLVLGSSFANAQDSAVKPGGAIDEMLIANERALQSSVSKADKASFLSLVLPDGVWTTTSGFVPMNLLVNGLEAFHISKWDIVNAHVTRLGEDSAVVLYSSTVAGTYGDRPFPSTMLSSTVWTRRNGKWLAAHHQDTELLPR
jgi:hypothetical protein